MTAVIEPVFDALQVTVDGTGLNKGKVGQKSAFAVDCSNAGEAPLTVLVFNEDGTKVPGIEVCDDGDGKYKYVKFTMYIHSKVFND